MSPTPRAAAELHGPVLRYADAAPDASGALRLARVGAVRFDFDTREALDGGNPGQIATLAAALADVFAGAEAAPLTLVLHAPGLVTWAAPVPDTTTPEDEHAALLREAALLTDQPADALHLAAWPLFGADGRHWVQALATPTAWPNRLAQMRPAAEAPRLDLAALAAARLLRQRRGGHLAVGAYDDHTAFALVVDGATRVVTSAPGDDPADAAYAALRFVQQAGPDIPLPTPHLFGPRADAAAHDAFALAFGPVEALDVAAPLGLDAPLANEATTRLFVPVLGALLA